MGRHVNRNYIKNLYNQCYVERQKHCNFCSKFDCRFCLKTENLEKELLRIKFSTANKLHNHLFLIYYQNNSYQITLFPVYTKT